MCLGISSPEGGSIKLAFVQEQIYLSKNGSKQVRADVLIENTGSVDVRRFRIELPCRLLATSEIDRRDEELEADSYRRLCREQCSRVHICTNKLVKPDDPDNWLYSSLPGIAIEPYRMEGKLSVIRRKQLLTGIVKQDWEVSFSKEIDDDPNRWFACFVNGITVVDYATKKGNESLKPKESMWVTLEFTVPRGGMQQVPWPPWWLRIIARQRSFPVIITSPKALAIWRTNQFDLFEKGIETVADAITAAGTVRRELQSIPHAEILDYRIFMRWSRRIAMERVQVPEGIIEPSNDYVLTKPKKCFFSNEQRRVALSPNHRQFWFGEYHKAPEPERGVWLEFKANVNSWIYLYVLPWIGFVGFCIAFYRWMVSLIKLPDGG